MTKQDSFFKTVEKHCEYLNTSKIFVGLIVLILNISSRFVNVKLSKTMESYLKYTFNRNILIFCIAFIPTRSILAALGVMFVFILCFDYLLNDESVFCILPESFKNHHINILENMTSSEGDGTNNLSTGIVNPSSSTTTTTTTTPTKKKTREEEIADATAFLNKEGFRVLDNKMQFIGAAML